MSRLITAREASNLLRVQPVPVYRMVKARKLPAVYPMGGRTIRLREADVLARMVVSAS
jgi:excisionase family DNA binding protein